MQVQIIETSELGDRSYVVHEGGTAVVIDPQRDIDRVLALLEEQGLTLAAAAETHIHNDYVTGGLELAQRTGADYLVNGDDDVAYDRTPVRDGEERSLRRPDGARDGHPGSHAHPSVLRRLHPERRRAGRVHRRLAAVRQRRAHRPARRGAHRHADAPAVPHGAPAGRGAPGRRGDLPDPRLRQLLLDRGGLGRRRVHHRPGEAAQPGADHRRGAEVRRRAHRQPDGLPRLLRPHAAPERRRPDAGRPEQAGAGRARGAAGAHRARRVGRRPAQPHALRQRPPVRLHGLRAERAVLHLPRLADPVGHPADADRRHRGRRRRRAAPARADRHRPPRRRGRRLLRRTSRATVRRSTPTP